MIPTINNNICEIMIANSTIYWNSSRLNNSDWIRNKNGSNKEYEFEPNLGGSIFYFPNNLKKSAKENFYVSINESLSELKNTNCKQYWKTIKMLIKGEGQSSEYPPLRSPNQNDVLQVSYGAEVFVKQVAFVRIVECTCVVLVWTT
jgi:hypothetical protein